MFILRVWLQLSSHFPPYRYDSLTGDLELVPVHAMPSTVLGSDWQQQQDGGYPRAPEGHHHRGLRLGFNVDDAATHIKLDSREGGELSSSSSAAAQQRGGGGAGAGGGQKGSRRRPGARRSGGGGKPPPPLRQYDPAAWSPQSALAGAGGALPSLIIRR